MQRLKHILHRYFIQLIPLSLCVEIKNLPKVIDLTCGYFQNLRLNLDTTMKISISNWVLELDTSNTFTLATF